MREMLARFMRDDEGQDLIEYGLLAGIITAGAIASIILIGPKVSGYFTKLNSQMP
jgi:pilus assembly protein Flp/PilA